MNAKIGQLLKLTFTDRHEFWDRLSIAVGRRLPWAGGSGSGLEHTAIIAEDCEMDLEPFFAEEALVNLEAEVRDAQSKLACHAPFSMTHSADYSFARFCYAACRATRPQTIVETGVAYGVTSYFILKAMELNECGRLWSIDLPPLVEQRRQFQGVLVPEHLRGRWRLLTGASRRILPPLIRELSAGIDIFIHDSLHTYANMLWEFRTAWPIVNGMLISDDVEQNSAFARFVSEAHPASASITRESHKEAAFGVAIKDARLVKAHPPADSLPFQADQV